MPFLVPQWHSHGASLLNDPGSRKESAPQVLLPEEEKIIVEETKSNGQTVIEERYDGFLFHYGSPHPPVHPMGDGLGLGLA